MAGQPLGSSEAPASAYGAGGGAPQSTTAIFWYVGRDGQQFGPVSDFEFRRAFEAGQLKATDLVWREGFAEWRAVSTLPPMPATQSHAQATPAGRPSDLALHSKPHSAERDDQPAASPKIAKAKRERRMGAKSRIGLGGIFRALFLSIMLAVAAFVVWINPDLLRMATALIPSFGGERIVATAPIGGFAKTAEATDAAMQQSRLWQVLKSYHADWYAARVQEATEAASAGKSDSEITNQMMQAVVKLRRQYAGDGMSAPLPRMKTIASLFVSNLVRLRGHSIDACYQFTSAGESAPAIVTLLQAPEYTSAIQAQVVATFEAINDGRRSPRIYPTPKENDYVVLVDVLRKKGWNDPELRLFSDSKALAQAPPETACRLITEWFDSQLGLSDPDVQMRLLVDSLRPVVAG